jgi:hypothetical protein
MTDIWLPGYPPAYTDWSYCVGVLELQGMDKGNAEILAAIGGPESGYDYTVINDTPATGDYSVGIWQINYLGSLYAERSREFGTPRELIAGGPVKQAHAAYSIWRSQGWMAWATTYTSGAWRQYIGSGPVPHPGQPGPGGPGHKPPVLVEPKIIDHYIIGLSKLERQLVWAINKYDRMGIHGLMP